MPKTNSLHTAATNNQGTALAIGTRAVIALLMALSSLMLCLPTDVSAKKAATPAWLSQITPLVHRRGSEPRPVELFYEVSWSKWLQAGSIQIKFSPATGKRNAFVEATSKARSGGPARVFWPYEGRTRTQIVRKTLLPDRFEHVEKEHGVKAEYKATFRNGRSTVQSKITQKDGTGVKRDKRAYDLDEIRDVLSALMYLRQAELRSNRKIVLLVLPLDRLYLVSFDMVGREQRKVVNKKWKTIKLGVKIRKVNNDLTLAPYTKMRSASIWLSDDDYRVPVEIQADLRIGFVSVRLLNRNAQ